MAAPSELSVSFPQHVDHYSRTKAVAEQAVLAANGRLLMVGDNCGGQEKQAVEGRRLKTCALRCAGIYGEGEQRHLPRIVVRSKPSYLISRLSLY